MDRSERGWSHCASLFSKHVGQTKIFRGSPWKCRASATAWLFKTVALLYVSFSLGLHVWILGDVLWVGSVWHLSSAPNPDGIIRTWFWHHLIGLLSGGHLRHPFSVLRVYSLPHSSEFVKNGNRFWRAWPVFFFFFFPIFRNFSNYLILQIEFGDIDLVIIGPIDQAKYCSHLFLAI